MPSANDPTTFTPIVAAGRTSESAPAWPVREGEQQKLSQRDAQHAARHHQPQHPGTEDGWARHALTLLRHPTSSRWIADSGETSSASSLPRSYALKTAGSM